MNPVQRQASQRQQWRPSGAAARGVTLMELMVTIAILALLVGAIVATLSNVDGKAQADMGRLKIAEIKRAAKLFRDDMGQAPRYVAELLQSPARPVGHPEYDPLFPSDGMGGWWWRDVPLEYPEKRLWKQDPSIQRGWNGPYLKPIDFRSATASEPVLEGTMSYIRIDGTTETVTSDSRNGRRVALATSIGQSTTKSPVVCDYRLNLTNELDVRLEHLALSSRPRQPASSIQLEIRR